MGSAVHGCDICQQVCPRNLKVLSRETCRDSYLEQVVGEFDLAGMLNMDDFHYEEGVRAMAYNCIHEKTWFQRNAAIALGNSRNTSAGMTKTPPTVGCLGS